MSINGLIWSHTKEKLTDMVPVGMLGRIHIIDYNNHRLGSTDNVAKIAADERGAFMYFVAGCRI
jgi:hypothetical protein